MTPEPEYTFIKGQGWVVRKCRTVETETRDGLGKIIIMDRVPEKGEPFICCLPEWVKDDQVELEQLIYHCSSFNLDTYQRTDWAGQRYFGDRHVVTLQIVSL